MVPLMGLSRGGGGGFVVPLTGLSRGGGLWSH